MNRSCSVVPHHTSFSTVGRLPEMRDERAHQQLLRQTHARVRRHLERAQLHQSEPRARGVRRIELVDAKFSAMRIAGHVGQEMPEDAINFPRQNIASALLRRLVKRNFQFIDRIRARFIHARMLTGGPDERPREKIRERRMVVPVTHQAAQ